MCAVVDGDEEATTLWDLSWALNTLGHSIVKINTFDWILACPSYDVSFPSFSGNLGALLFINFRPEWQHHRKSQGIVQH